MREVEWAEYEAYLAQRREVVIEDTRIALTGRKQVDCYHPAHFETETTTVWSFPNRGEWATHQGNYRGNWAPQIPRNLLLRYTQPGDTVLDPMVGSGTTLVECRLLGRNGIGVDVNYQSLMVTLDKLNFDHANLYETLPPSKIRVFHGDARRLDLLDADSVDLIATHPPYAGIITYSKSEPVAGDLSQLHSLSAFLEAMRQVGQECYRVLKPNKHCAILIGDTRKHKHYIVEFLLVVSELIFIQEKTNYPQGSLTRELYEDFGTKVDSACSTRRRFEVRVAYSRHTFSNTHAPPVLSASA